MLLTFFLTQSVLLAYNTAKRTVELWLINTTTLCRNNKLTNAQSVGNTFLIFSWHNTVTNKSLKKKSLIDLVFITQTKKKNGHVEIQPQLKKYIYIYVGHMTHFLYSMLCLVSFVYFLLQQGVIPRYLRPSMQNFRRMYKKWKRIYLLLKKIR